MSSKSINPSKYVSLERAKELDNAKPEAQAWVWSRSSKSWELHSRENFANQEQVDFLISKKVFYYAPEKRFDSL